MRTLSAVINDIRYQARYGFYLIYAVLTVLYVLVLGLIGDPAVRGTAAGLILLSDPAVLGFFFIGGIWLLERDEDLHSYAAITPQRAVEYVAGKVVSLGLISTSSAVVICGAALPGANLPVLAVSVFLSSAVFTLMGLVLATFAKSVNGYMLFSVVPAILMLAPAVLAAFGIEHFLAELVPGTMALRLIFGALVRDYTAFGWYFAGLALWGALLFALAAGRVRRRAHPKGGHSHAADG